MIAILFTGGTISMRHDPVAGGAVPALSGREILAATRGAADIAELRPEDFSALPGPHMTTELQWSLRTRVRELLDDASIDGVVITHGTDTLEESAYLLARSLPVEKPVVFTGAMRTSSDLGWDGPANLLDSLRVASSPLARGYGTLVVMGGRIFSGLDVTKSHTHLLDAFESPGVGPVGVVDDGCTIFRRALPPNGSRLDPPALATPVDIVPAYAGADSRLLDASREVGHGVVVSALGRGNVPLAMVDGLRAWVDEGKPVVIASRAQRGRVGPTYGYAGAGRRLAEMGCLLAGGRRPLQARIDLMLAIGAGMDTAALAELFAT